MFERFLRDYEVTESGTAADFWPEPTLMSVSGYAELSRRVAGLALGGGIFRMHASSEGLLAQRLISEMFPEMDPRAVPFGRDWLGRQFAVDRARSSEKGPMLLLLEPGSGDVFEIDSTFSDFIDGDLVDDKVTFLEPETFEQWLAAGGARPGPLECVGYKVPLFMGGGASVENLEITDLEVYWDLTGQMWSLVKNLKPDTQIGSIEMSEE